ncbi:MAG: hypothetical protein PHX51_07345 [Clostridia bacterium]|nr:hypothetical protein [Clostridia bacterium]
MERIGIEIKNLAYKKHTRKGGEALRLASAFVLSVAAVSILLNPGFTCGCVIKGSTLFAKNVLPSLFPMIFVCKCLTTLVAPSIKPKTAKMYLYATSIFFGYPLGAKTLYDLRKQNIFTKEEALRVAPYTNNSGPMFILGVIGVHQLGNVRVAWIIYAVHIVSSLFICLSSRIINNYFRHRNKKDDKYNIETNDYSNVAMPSEALDTVENTASVAEILWDSIKAILSVGGYMILFAPIAGVLNETILSKNLNAVLLSAIEMSNATQYISTNFCLASALPLLSASIGFGGLCVFLQSTGYYDKCGVDSKIILAYKILQGVSSFLLCKVLLIYIAV